MGGAGEHVEGVIDWAVASRPHAGESKLGDLCLHLPIESGELIAVADGLGHGLHAASAAQRTIVTLREDSGQDVVSLIRRCHERLLGTRGVVLTVVKIDSRSNTLTWAGVGNVEARVLRAADGDSYERFAPVLQPGVVGYRLPTVRSAQIGIVPGDLIILATDGVSSDFDQDINIGDPPKRIADLILEEKGKMTDDVLVFVARYIGKELAGGPAASQ